MAATSVNRKCPRCGGTGQRNPDGVRIIRRAGFFATAERMKDRKVVSNVQMLCWPAVVNTPLIVCDIIRMYTRPNHRKKGYATQIIVQMQAMKHILGMRTSWTDSENDGRKLLVKLGFQRKGSLLIWENQYAYGLIAKGLNEKGKLEQIIKTGQQHDPRRPGTGAENQPENEADDSTAADNPGAGHDSEDSPPRITGTGQ